MPEDPEPTEEPATFEAFRKRKLAELDAALARGIADVEAGRVHTADEVFRYFRARYQKMADEREQQDGDDK